MKYRSMKDIPTPAHRYKPTYIEALAVRHLGTFWTKTARMLDAASNTTDATLLRQLYQDGYALYHKAVETVQKAYLADITAGRQSTCPGVLIPKPDKVS